MDNEPVGLARGLTQYGDADFAVYLRRSFANSTGLSAELLRKPVVGIASTYSEFNNCHRLVPELVTAVKRGVLAAGGLPLEFPVISLGEIFLNPTSLFFRNLMSMDVEEMLRGQPMDAVVLIGGCDKTVPAQLMGAVSAGVPAIQVVTGPMMTGSWRGERLGACTDCRRFWARYRAGEVSPEDIEDIERNLSITAGTCSVMGTASTMASLSEALGMMLPGTAAIPAVHADRLRAAEASGKAAMALVGSKLTPDRIITEKSIENAVRVLMAIGGSTNAIIHLAAIAGRAGAKFDLARLNEISDSTPVLRYIPEWFHYYGGLADKIEGGVPPIDKAEMFVFTKREPLGVVVCITPWNSPLMLLSWKLAPALAAGCTIVVKPSEFTSCSTLALMELVEEAGFPPGVINTVTGFGAEVGPTLVEHPKVAKIAFTGGDATGAAIYAQAARGLKHVTLELGGKSPNIIFDDANLEDAVKGAISGIFAASGQTCIAGSRLLVQRTVYDEVSEKVAALAATAKLGDPMDAGTQVGPITTTAQRDKVLGYIDVARADGARLLLGGARPEDPALANGWFVQPTIFADVSNGMRIAQEEVFGPVLSILPFEDEAEAVEIANDTIYGLASGVRTGSIRRAFTMADRIRAGTVWVNTYRAVSYMAPFGGYKMSGLAAIDEYLQTKSVWINLAEGIANPFVIR